MLNGLVALITGGANGIGRASAYLFAREGARIVIADLPDVGGAEVVADLQAGGSDAAFLSVDVSDDDSVRRLTEQIVDRFGRLDCAFNNAGVESPSASLHETTMEAYRRQISVNLDGVWNCLRHEVVQMARQGGGAIVNMGSEVSLSARKSMSAYVAAKHGVVGLTRAAALEYAGHGIRVNAVCPGPIRTTMVDRFLSAQPEPEDQLMARLTQDIPLGRFGRADEAAEAAVWLCSPRSSYITGQALLVDGGRSTT